MNHLENTQSIKLITMKPVAFTKCVIGQDWYRNELEIIFEPGENAILNAAVPEYVAGMLVASVRESFASEVAARRAAMDAAGKNAREMIDDLMLQYNRARQGAITQEITEIVAGGNA